MNQFKLDNKEKITPGFKIPEAYFDTFSDKVIKQLPENKPKVISIFNLKKVWFYSVAAVFIIALSIPIINLFDSPKSDIDSITLENYICNQTNISEDEIIALLDENDIQKIKLENNLEEEFIEDYLLLDENLEENIVN